MSSIINSIAMRVATKLNDGGVSTQFKRDAILAPIAGEIASIGDNIIDSNQQISLEDLSDTLVEHFESNAPNDFEIPDNLEHLGNTFTAGVDAIVEDVMPIVTGIIGDVKTKVIPATNEIFKNAYGVASEKINTGAIKLEIVSDGLESPIFKNPAFLQIVESVANSADVSITSTAGISFPEIDTETLLECLKKINGSLSGDIVDYLGNDYDRILKGAMYTVFNAPSSTNYVAGASIADDIKVRVAALLLSVYFMEDVPEGVTGVDDIDKYREAVLEVSRTYAALVRAAFAYSDALYNQGQLVRAYPNKAGIPLDEGTIVVVGRTFNEFIELGGEVDLIFGAYVSDKNVNLQPLMENADRYNYSWTQYVSRRQSIATDRFQAYFQTALKSEVIRYAQENNLKLDDDVIDDIYDVDGVLDPDNAYLFTRKIVCDAFFDDGEYLQIISTVDSIIAKNPEIKLDDAVDTALIDWLVSWTLDQVTVTKK